MRKILKNISEMIIVLGVLLVAIEGKSSAGITMDKTAKLPYLKAVKATREDISIYKETEQKFNESVNCLNGLGKEAAGKKDVVQSKCSIEMVKSLKKMDLTLSYLLTDFSAVQEHLVNAIPSEISDDLDRIIANFDIERGEVNKKNRFITKVGELSIDSLSDEEKDQIKNSYAQEDQLDSILKSLDQKKKAIFQAKRTIEGYRNIVGLMQKAIQLRRGEIQAATVITEVKIKLHKVELTFCALNGDKDCSKPPEKILKEFLNGDVLNKVEKATGIGSSPSPSVYTGKPIREIMYDRRDRYER